MVGVPGRSKACHTCKRRKRGCDQQQPSCGQCQLSNLPCEGYMKPRIFVNSNQGHGDAITDRFTPQSYSASPLVRSDFKVPGTQALSHAEVALLSVPISSVSQKSLERTSLESKYFETFWTSLLPNGEPFSPQAAALSPLGWTCIVPSLCTSDDLVRLALLANATGLLGQHSGEQALIVEGWRMYGRAMHALAALIPAASQERNDRLQVASKLMAQFELLQAVTNRDPSSPPGPTWIKHAGGEEAIIISRGPDYYVDGCAHQLFADARLHLVKTPFVQLSTTKKLLMRLAKLYPSIMARKRSIFGSPEWKTIPWSLHPKSPKDQLLDVMVELPGLLEDVHDPDRMPNVPEQRTFYLQRLEDRCWLYDSQLQTWSSTSGLATMAFTDANINIEHDEHSRPSIEDFAIAHLGLLYLTTCCMLYYTMGHINEKRQLELPHRVDPMQYCRKIVMLIPYFQVPGMGACFMNMVCFPAAVATRFLLSAENSDEELRMLQRSFRGRHGLKLRRFLVSWPWRTEAARNFFKRDAEFARVDMPAPHSDT